jgi:hypothetical protein
VVYAFALLGIGKAGAAWLPRPVVVPVVIAECLP